MGNFIRVALSISVEVCQAPCWVSIINLGTLSVIQVAFSSPCAVEVIKHALARLYTVACSLRVLLDLKGPVDSSTTFVVGCW